MAEHEMVRAALPAARPVARLDGPGLRGAITGAAAVLAAKPRPSLGQARSFHSGARAQGTVAQGPAWRRLREALERAKGTKQQLAQLLQPRDPRRAPLDVAGLLQGA